MTPTSTPDACTNCGHDVSLHTAHGCLRRITDGSRCTCAAYRQADGRGFAMNTNASRLERWGTNARDILVWVGGVALFFLIVVPLIRACIS